MGATGSCNILHTKKPLTSVGLSERLLTQQRTNYKLGPIPIHVRGVPCVLGEKGGEENMIYVNKIIIQKCVNNFQKFDEKQIVPINAREYRRDNKNGQSRETGNIHKTKKEKNTTQYMLDTTLYANKHK